ncbi:MAG: DUF389 domain-containing protein [Caldilineales bacterium]|nr:DUF389 domain-containing protein [Caldilineales bacterium]
MSNQILVPAASARRARRLLPLAIPFAHHWQAEIVLLHIVLPGAMNSNTDAENSERNGWLQDIADELQEAGITATTLIRSGSNAYGVIQEVAAEIEPRLLLMSWRGEPGGNDGTGRVKVSDLMLDVRCDLLAWHGPNLKPRPLHILLPSGGGPNAQLGVEIASALIDEYGGEVTVISVLGPDAGPDDIDQTQTALQAQVDELFPDRQEQVGVQIVTARNPASGILDAAAKDDFDLIMIGASREHTLSQLVFGVVPQQVMRHAEIPVLVVRRPPSRRVTWSRKAWAQIKELTPTLTEAQKAEAYISIRRSARFDPDFLTMMALSTLIASLGLLLNSTAVVIGAMLVAPLMGAIVALGLGVVHGDANLLKLAFLTTLKGVILAIPLAFVTGVLSRLIIPGIAMTPEMYARGQPGLLDLFVAIFAGAAGAYALCRQSVKASLPGVAIAVALVPPLATVGLSLALGDFGNASGAMLLFVTNLIGIAATGGLVFLLMGFQPEPSRPERMQLFVKGWRGLGILVAVILLVLVWATVQSGKTTCEREFRGGVGKELCAQVDSMKGGTLLDFSTATTETGVLTVTVDLAVSEPLSQDKLQLVQENMATALGRPVALEVHAIPTYRLTPSP